MVEQVAHLDRLFGSLADPIRRDILKRLISAQYTVSEIAQNYRISFAAVAKHLSVLEKALLVKKQKRGKEVIISIVAESVHEASTYLKQYEKLWGERFDRLDTVLMEDI